MLAADGQEQGPNQSRGFSENLQEPACKRSDRDPNQGVRSKTVKALFVKFGSRLLVAIQSRGLSANYLASNMAAGEPPHRRRPSLQLRRAVDCR
jgi:hypothetical protein